MDNRPGVRQAYYAATDRTGNPPTLDEVCAGCPTLERGFVRSTLEREGLTCSAGEPTQRTANGVRSVYNEPIQMSPGEPPVIRGPNGIRPAMGVAYKDRSGQVCIQTKDGVRRVR